jgi:type VI protein secretion system component Hcp
MAKARTKRVRNDKRRVRDLGVKAATQVKGGTATPKLMLACATGQHIKEATITVR